VQGKKSRNAALVVTSRNVHRHIVTPVIDELRNRGWTVRVLRLERIWERAERFLSKTTRRRSLKSFYTQPSEEKPHNKKERLYLMLSKFFLDLTRLLHIRWPDIVVVLTDTTPPCRIAVLTAKLAHTPSLLLLHSGMIGRNYECPDFVVDKIAVPGDYARGILRNCGVDEKRLVVTGYPSYDALVQAENHFQRNVICRKLELDPEKRILVFTTENLPVREGEQLARVVYRSVKEFPSMQFVVKVHPSESDLSIYGNLAKEFGLKVVITKDASIYEVLYVCDLVITGFSATALDAMMLDKPVITVNLTGMEDPIPFAESGAAIGVHNEKNLIKALEKGLYDEASRKSLESAREKFVYEHAYKSDGKATARVVTLIEQIVTGQ
jgi:UDP-N-acetylglucosamine 2-epimerase